MNVGLLITMDLIISPLVSLRITSWSRDYVVTHNQGGQHTDVKKRSKSRRQSTGNHCRRKFRSATTDVRNSVSDHLENEQFSRTPRKRVRPSTWTLWSAAWINRFVQTIIAICHYFVQCSSCPRTEVRKIVTLNRWGRVSLLFQFQKKLLVTKKITRKRRLTVPVESSGGKTK